MKLGDRAYWLIQDDWNGGLRTSARAAGVVVAGAVVAELIAEHALEVGPDEVIVRECARPLDDLGFDVVAQIAAEPGISAAEAIDGLSPSIRERVARRLIKSGVADERRVGVRRRRVAVARDGDIGPAQVRAGLAGRVQRGLPLAEDERLLLQLVRYSSMIGNPLSGIPPDQAAYALRLTGSVIGRYDVLVQAATDAIRAAAVAR